MKQSFILKASVVLLLMWGVGTSLASRYRIGIDPQQEKCLPQTFYLVDLKDRSLERGAIYAFKARGLAPLFQEGTWMVKILVAMPGDTVEVNAQQIAVNGKPVGEGLPLAQQLHLPESHFYGKSVLEDGHYWFMGTSPLSFDSRYWGAVEDDQIIGRTYPLI